MGRRIALIAILLAGGGVLFAVQRHKVTTPITPRPVLYLVADAEREAERLPLEATRVSDAEELRVGAELSRYVCPRKERGSNPDYVGNVGEKVALNVKRQGIPYTFCVQEDNFFVNAYALPGGYVVIGRGLLALLESEDELAFILGHEIAHVDDRHAIERVQYQLASRKLGLEGLYELGQPAQVLYEAGYSKEQELEADRDGLELAYEAGYSPRGALNVMQRFERMDREMKRATGSPIEEFANVPLQSLQEYFRSHPPAVERFLALQQVVTSRRWNFNAPVRPYGLRPMFLSEQAAGLDKQGKWQRSISTYSFAIHLDPTYQAALDGLARVEWRSGDAAAAERAAIAATARVPSVATMRILARAGAAANRDDAVKALGAVGGAEDMNVAFARVEIGGLASERNASVMADYQRQLGAVAGNMQWQATLRTEMAWWMYRAGDLKDAAAELEAAHQSFPAYVPAMLWRAWVDSEMGRQADAENDLEPGNGGGLEEVADVSSQMAARAVVSWRVGNRDLAKSQFQQAAAGDEVWMVRNWVQDTFSVSAAGILVQLQAAEMARREEEARKQREAH